MEEETTRRLSNRAPTGSCRENGDAFDPDYIASLVLLRFGGRRRCVAGRACRLLPQRARRSGVQRQLPHGAEPPERVIVAIKRRNRL